MHMYSVSKAHREALIYGSAPATRYGWLLPDGEISHEGHNRRRRNDLTGWLSLPSSICRTGEEVLTAESLLQIRDPGTMMMKDNHYFWWSIILSLMYHSNRHLNLG
jgi:hypothetical protein